MSLYALYWVVRPQPAQPYRTSFLAVTLAMTLLAYRPLTRGGTAADEEREPGHDNRPGQGRGRPQLPGGEPVDGPELAYRLTRLLFDQQEALGEVHPAAKRLERETAPNVAPLELHPGARRYYDEQAKT